MRTHHKTTVPPAAVDEKDPKLGTIEKLQDIKEGKPRILMAKDDVKNIHDAQTLMFHAYRTDETPSPVVEASLTKVEEAHCNMQQTIDDIHRLEGESPAPVAPAAKRGLQEHEKVCEKLSEVKEEIKHILEEDCDCKESAQANKPLAKPSQPA